MNSQILNKISALQQRNQNLEQALCSLVAIIMSKNAEKGDDGKLHWTGDRVLHAATNAAMRAVAKPKKS